MPLIRGHHSFDDHYTQIPNDWVRDTRLSLKAIGLLAQIMSHTPGWRMSIRSLARVNGVGQDTIKSAILELENCGYLIRSEKQQHNDDGTFADYDFTTKDPFQNPVTVKPRHGETGHKEEHYLEKNINNRNSHESHEHEQFKEFWKEYPRKTDKRAGEKAFRSALTRATFEDILAGAIRYANDPNLPEMKYIKHPATWLNADAWENGPLPDDPRKRKEREKEEAKRKLEEYLRDQE